MKEPGELNNGGLVGSLEDLEQWFEVNTDSFRTYWFPREVLFRGDLRPEVTATDLAWLQAGPQSEFHVDHVGQRRTLTARWYRELIGHRYKLHLTLFFTTLFTTITCGATFLGDPFSVASICEMGLTGFGHWVKGQVSPEWPQFLALVSNGLYFSLPFLLILSVHEFGHYFAARHYRMRVSLPFFIPIPMGIGSMGAVIAMKSPLVHRRSVFDVGVAGPLAGFLIALPVFYYGLTISKVDLFANHPNAMFYEEGQSLLYKFLLWHIHGALLPSQFISLHPVAWAGWFGLLITAMNLIPAGQLDGGHISYAMLGQRHLPLAWACFLALLGFAVLFKGYLLFAALVFFLVKLRHPPALDESVPLGTGRWFLGWFMFLVFIVTFVPDPMEVIYP